MISKNRGGEWWIFNRGEEKNHIFPFWSRLWFNFLFLRSIHKYLGGGWKIWRGIKNQKSFEAPKRRVKKFQNPQKTEVKKFQTPKRGRGIKNIWTFRFSQFSWAMPLTLVEIAMIFYFHSNFIFIFIDLLIHSSDLLYS